MKPNIHPEYRPVAFVDLSINKTFIIPSAVQTRETVEIDGVTYPLFKLDTSSASHPFYTGAQTRIVEAGRVEKFRAKFAAKKQDNDILTHIIVKKTPLKAAYESFRNTETDFPVLTVAAARTEHGLRCAVGARPARAELVEGADEAELLERVQSLTYGGNTRAGGEYRAHLAGVLTRRCLAKLRGGEQA